MNLQLQINAKNITALRTLLLRLDLRIRAKTERDKLQFSDNFDNAEWLNESDYSIGTLNAEITDGVQPEMPYNDFLNHHKTALRVFGGNGLPISTLLRILHDQVCNIDPDKVDMEYIVKLFLCLSELIIVYNGNIKGDQFLVNVYQYLKYAEDMIKYSKRNQPDALFPDMEEPKKPAYCNH